MMEVKRNADLAKYELGRSGQAKCYQNSLCLDVGVVGQVFIYSMRTGTSLNYYPDNHVCPSVCLGVCLAVCLGVCLGLFLGVYLFVCFGACLGVFLGLSLVPMT